MSRPAMPPAWATNTNYSAGTDSGQPAKVDPGSGVYPNGFVPGQGAVGAWLNFLLAVVNTCILYLFSWAYDTNQEHTYETPKTRTIYLNPHSGWEWTLGGLTSRFVHGTDIAGLTDASNKLGLTILPGTSQPQFIVPLNLPRGVVLQSVTINFSSSQNASRTSKATVSLRRYPGDTNIGITSGVGGAYQDDLIVSAAAPAGPGNLVLGLTHTVVDGPYYVEVLAGVDVGSLAADQIELIQVVFTDIGPRNA